jgi:hypothetical protein
MQLLGVSVLLLAACGRLGFESRLADPDAGVGQDTMLDSPSFCMSDPCTLVLPQCGCPSGKACHRTGATTDTRECVAEGTATADELCGEDVDCVGGHLCAAQSANSGRCHLYCAGDADCAPGLSCAQLTEGVGVGLCGSACTLDAGCPAGSTCKVVLAFDFDSAAPVAVPLCGDPTGGGSGAGCGSSLECAADLFCDDAGVCRPMCRFDGTLDCTTGSCTNPLAPINLGGVGHGFCR